jgi:hypothetical protein
LLAYFVVALIAFVVVRIVEIWRKAKTGGKEAGDGDVTGAASN